MTEALYQEAILARAKAAVGAGTLDHADARVTVDNPLCGDRITMEVRMADGTVQAIAYKVRGCVLCQAAASVIAQRAPGNTPAELASVQDDVRAMLQDGGMPPTGAWDDLSVFSPVAAHKSRHECVLLPFEALRRALDQVST